eukprot:scaffold14981_cov90-Cylindrotheca_fusiformis.AAC.3
MFHIRSVTRWHDHPKQKERRSTDRVAVSQKVLLINEKRQRGRYSRRDDDLTGKSKETNLEMVMARRQNTDRQM